MHNNNNIFTKIIAGEIPTEKLYEDDQLIAIKDINPEAPIHLLVITKGNYVDLDDFTSNASDKEIAHYFKQLAVVAKENNATEYRIVANKGAKSGQSIFHFHTHILSGLNNEKLINKNL